MSGGGTTGSIVAHAYCPIYWPLDSSRRLGTGTVNDPYNFELTCVNIVPDLQCPEGSCHGQGAHPIFPEDGTSRLSDADYIDPRGTLSFERYYNSSQQAMGLTFGQGVLPPSQAGGSPPLNPGATASVSSQYWMPNGSAGGTVSQVFGTFHYINSARAAGNAVQVVRPGGLLYDYTWDGTTATAASSSTRDALRFTPPATGNGAPAWAANGQWSVRRALSDETERYDASGVLRQVQYRNGQTKSLTYSDSNTPAIIAPGPGYLIGVTDAFGKALSLRYDSYGRMATLTDPVGQTVTYGYEQVWANSDCKTADCFRIKTVTYPDGQTKTFHWDEAAYSNSGSSTNVLFNLLTGMTDENGQRISTIRYNSSGLVVSTELAGGVSRYTFSNVQPRASAVVTDPLGAQRTFRFVNAQGLTQLSSITGAACDDCGPASATYDSNGNVASQVDFAGRVTCFGYDLTRNLETTRVEGLPTGTTCPSNLASYVVPAGARKISTQWHPVWRQPIKVAEPKQITTYVFNGDGGQFCAPASARVDDTPIGVSCSQTVQPTGDIDGSQGFGAAATGTARTMRWTYDGDGQVLSTKGPRTDVNDQISYVYRTADDTASPPQYRRGDLYQVTDALGHCTTFERMDPNGRPLQMTDANGVVTTFTYAPRGWLTSQAVTPVGGAGQTTRYSYDNAGQLTQVVQPDGSTVRFDYDAAHRLTAISDGMGNRITYTLDAMGNRVQEQAKDPSGALARQVTRAINNLNRLQTLSVGAVAGSGGS